MWLLLKYHGGAAEIVDAEVTDPFALPEAFFVARVTTMSTMENPATTKAREAIIDKFRNQDKIAQGTRSEFEIKKWRDAATAKCDQEIAALPKLDPVKSAKRDATTKEFPKGIQLRSGIVQVWPLPPDWVAVCEKAWETVSERDGEASVI